MSEHDHEERRPPEHRPTGKHVENELAALKLEVEELKMALSARAQAIVDRITALNENIQSKIVADEAAHDATNAAATDADDTAVESALSTLEGSVGAAPSSPDAQPIPAAEPQPE